jgi:hypothetical protein
MRPSRYRCAASPQRRSSLMRLRNSCLCSTLRLHECARVCCKSPLKSLLEICEQQKEDPTTKSGTTKQKGEARQTGNRHRLLTRSLFLPSAHVFLLPPRVWQIVVKFSLHRLFVSQDRSAYPLEPSSGSSPQPLRIGRSTSSRVFPAM